jgi:dihydrofolate reductase
MPCWVWTRGAIRSLLPSVSVTSEEPSAFLSAAQEWGLVHLWLVGGGILAAAFQAQHLISKYVISFIPVVLGNGISLFHGQGIIEELVLQKSRSFASGLVQSTYVPK